MGMTDLEYAGKSAVGQLLEITILRTVLVGAESLSFVSLTISL